MGRIEIVKSNFGNLFERGGSYPIAESKGLGSGSFASYCTFPSPDGGRTFGLKIFKHVERQDPEGFRCDGDRAANEFKILSELDTAMGHAPRAYALAHYIDGRSRQWAIVEQHISASGFYEIGPIILNDIGNRCAAALEVGRSVCESLACCHSFDSGAVYVHRDASFSNIRFDYDPYTKQLHCVLLDFGQGARVNGTVTVAGKDHGSNIPYGAPEMFNLREPSKKAASLDTWGVAALMHKVALDSYPFQAQLAGYVERGLRTGDDLIEIRNIKSQDPDLSALGGGKYEVACAEILRAGLVANPRKRPTPQEMLSLIVHALARIRESADAARPGGAVAASRDAHSGQKAPGGTDGARPGEASAQRHPDAVTPMLPVSNQRALAGSAPQSRAMAPAGGRWEVDMVLFDDGELVVNPAPADYAGREVLHSENTACYSKHLRQWKNFPCWGASTWAAAIKRVRFAQACRPGPKDLVCFFSKLTQLESIDFGALDTSLVTDLSETFYMCGAKNIDLSGLDLRNVQAANLCFYWSDAKAILLPASGMGALQEIYSAFGHCESLQELDLSGIPSSQELCLPELFAGCKKLRKVNLGSRGVIVARCLILVRLAAR